MCIVKPANDLKLYTNAETFNRNRNLTKRIKCWYYNYTDHFNGVNEKWFYLLLYSIVLRTLGPPTLEFNCVGYEFSKVMGNTLFEWSMWATNIHEIQWTSNYSAGKFFPVLRSLQSKGHLEGKITSTRTQSNLMVIISLSIKQIRLRYFNIRPLYRKSVHFSWWFEQLCNVHYIPKVRHITVINENWHYKF